MKRCSGCGKEKGLAEYYSGTTRKDGYYARCKSCHIELTQAWNQRNPERRREINRAAQRRRRERQRASRVLPAFLEERVFLGLVAALHETGRTDEEARNLVAGVFRDALHDFDQAQAPEQPAPEREG